MLLVGAGEWPDWKLQEIMVKKIEKNEVIELPDLPINLHALKKPIKD